MKNKLTSFGLTFLMLILILFSSLGFSLTTAVQAQELQPAILQDALSISGDSVNEENEWGFYYTYDDVVAMVKENIKERLVAESNARENKVTFKNVTERHTTLPFIPNYNQTLLNNNYNEAYNRNINGTCTLVALTEIMRAIRWRCDDQYKSIFNIDKNDVFAGLVEASESWNNNYEEGAQQGTQEHTYGLIIRSYIKPIFEQTGVPFEFYYDGNHHCFDSNPTNWYRGIDFIEYDNIVPLSLMTIKTYNKKEAHSVALAGAYEFTVDYKYNTTSGWNWLFPKSESTKYVVFVVLNGWANADVGGFGRYNNFQYLVLDYDLPFDITTFNWYDLCANDNYISH